jgi:hypothetical protein
MGAMIERVTSGMPRARATLDVPRWLPWLARSLSAAMAGAAIAGVALGWAWLGGQGARAPAVIAAAVFALSLPGLHLGLIHSAPVPGARDPAVYARRYTKYLLAMLVLAAVIAAPPWLTRLVIERRYGPSAGDMAAYASFIVWWGLLALGMPRLARRLAPGD